MFDFLKPAKYAAPIQDKQQVDALYRYWRWRTFYSMFVGYAFFYLTRKSFTFAMPGMIAELGYDKASLGVLATILSLSYGMSKFVSGIASDKSNARYFMAMGLILTGIVNICFGFSSSLFFFALFWGMNGWFQGFGWPPCARLLTHWYSQSERGGWWSSWNASHNVGGAVIPLIAGACSYYLGWRYAMFIPGVLCIGVGVFLINRLRDTPQSLGLPSIEEWRGDYSGHPPEKGGEHELTTREILWTHVICNPFIWLLAMASFFVYIVRIGVNDWSALFLVESKSYNQIMANGCVSFFEVGGFCGSLAAGWISDRLFRAQRGPVNLIFAAGMLIAILAFWMLPQGMVWLDYASMFFVGFCVFGPQMMIGMAAAELSHKKAAATATGFIGWFGYAGAALAGYPLGKLTQDYGWNGFYIFLALCCFASVALLAPLWFSQSKSKSPVLA